MDRKSEHAKFLHILGEKRYHQTTIAIFTIFLGKFDHL